jgi:guanylate kinase
MDANMKEILIILCGRSGCGKSTVAQYLNNKYNLTVIQSFTTRPKRTSNEQGHIFISKEDFAYLHDYVAYTKFNGYEYCATEQQVEENNIYILDPNGIEYFNEHYGGNKIPLVIQIKAPWYKLILNMRHRGDSWKQIISRRKNDKIMFKNLDKMSDCVIKNNSTIQQCGDEIYNIYARLLAFINMKG